MKRALAAVTLVLVANGVLLLLGASERSAPATLTTVEVCASHLTGGPGSDEPPTLRLDLAHDSAPVPAGLDAGGLRALGFSEAALAAVGRRQRAEYRAPFDRPAWVRLRQRREPDWTLVAVEVAPRRELLRPDTSSLIVPGLVALRAHWRPPPADSGHVHGARPTPGEDESTVEPYVSELELSRLHLSRDQIATLRAELPDTAGCAITVEVVVAQGTRGGIWVAGVRQ